MGRMTERQSLFFAPSSKRLSRIIKLDSPMSARESVRELRKDGVTKKELRAANLAANRADAQQKRKNLSGRERREFKEVESIYRNFVTRSTESEEMSHAK